MTTRERTDAEKMTPAPVGATMQAALGDSPYPTDVETLQIACVLKGDWPRVDPQLKARVPALGEQYVENLYAMVSRFAPRNIPWKFTCFTDRLPHHMPDVPTRKLPENIDGWFNKLYVFSPDAYPEGSRVLYFDLDTAIVGDLTPLSTVPLDRPVFLRDVWAASHAASGLFSFRAGSALYPIWNEFEPQSARRRPFRSPRPYPMRVGAPTGGIQTDEQWLHHYIYPNGWRAWQDLLPGACLSFKYNVQRNGEKIGPSTKVVFFHGQPRPHDVVRKWNPHWRGVHPTLEQDVTA